MPADALDTKNFSSPLCRSRVTISQYGRVEGRCETMTHDYQRIGPTTLFAALDVAEGRLMGQCVNRHQESIKFLKLMDAETSPEPDPHLIVDNYATHKHPKVRSWLKRPRRFHLRFTPTRPPDRIW